MDHPARQSKQPVSASRGSIGAASWLPLPGAPRFSRTKAHAPSEAEARRGWHVSCTGTAPEGVTMAHKKKVLSILFALGVLGSFGTLADRALAQTVTPSFSACNGGI